MSLNQNKQITKLAANLCNVDHCAIKEVSFDTYDQFGMNVRTIVKKNDKCIFDLRSKTTDFDFVMDFKRMDPNWRFLNLWVAGVVGNLATPTYPRQIKVKATAKKFDKLKHVVKTGWHKPVTQESLDRYAQQAVFLNANEAVIDLFANMPDYVPIDFKRSLKYFTDHAQSHGRKLKYTCGELFQVHFKVLEKMHGKLLPEFERFQLYYSFVDKYECDVSLEEAFNVLDYKQKCDCEYYPEGTPEGHKEMSVKGTVEKLVCYWVLCLRYTTSPLEAYHKFVEWVVTFDRGIAKLKPRHEKLAPLGVFLFYARILRLGVNDSEFTTFHRLFKERSKPLSEQAVNFDWENYDVGGTMREWKNKVLAIPEVKSYVYEMLLHNHFVNVQLKHFGFAKPKHDFTKMDRKSVLVFTYHWYVKPKLPEPTAFECENCENPFPHDKNGCTTDNFSKRLLGNVEAAKKWAGSAIGGVVPMDIKALVNGAFDQLRSLGSFVNSVLDKLSGVIAALSRALGFKMDAKESMFRALDVVKYYVMYINTDSTAIRALLIYSICSTLGIVSKIASFFEAFDNQIFEEAEKEELASLNVPKETSFSDTIYSYLVRMYDCISSLSPTTVAIPLVMIVFIVCGYKVLPSEYTSLGTGFVAAMKNMHFIGGGVVGLGRVFSTICAAFKYSFEWIGKKLFNRVPEDEQKAKELEQLVASYTRWQTQLDLISEESFSVQLMKSQLLKEHVDSLYSEYVRYRVMYNKQELPRELANTFQNYANKMQKVHNICMRARATDSFRPCPFHVQFVGTAGVGKSHLIKNFVNGLKAKYWPDEQSLVYACNPGTEYADGYQGQPIWMVDDIFPVDDCADFVPLLQMVSNVPFRLPMAHLEEKGRFFESDLIVTTTNNPYPKPSGLYCPNAIWRRRHILAEVTINPKVKDPNRGQFSQELFDREYPNCSSHDYPHLTFSLMTPDKPNHYMEELDETALPEGVVKPLKNLSYKDFRQRLEVMFDNHRKNEQSFVEKGREAHINRIRQVLRELDEIIADGPEVMKNNPFYTMNFEDSHHTMPDVNEPEPVNVTNVTDGCPTKTDVENILAGIPDNLRDSESFKFIDKFTNHSLINMSEFYDYCFHYAILVDHFKTKEDMEVLMFHASKLLSMKYVQQEVAKDIVSGSLEQLYEILKVEVHDQDAPQDRYFVMQGVMYLMTALTEAKLMNWIPDPIMENYVRMRIQQFGNPTSTALNLNDVAPGEEQACITDLEDKIANKITDIKKCIVRLDPESRLKFPWIVELSIDMDPTRIMSIKSSVQGEPLNTYLDDLYDMAQDLIAINVESRRRRILHARGFSTHVPHDDRSLHNFGLIRHESCPDYYLIKPHQNYPVYYDVGGKWHPRWEPLSPHEGPIAAQIVMPPELCEKLGVSHDFVMSYLFLSNLKYDGGVWYIKPADYQPLVVEVNGLYI